MTKIQACGVGLMLSAIFGAIQTQGHDTSHGSWMYADMASHLLQFVGLQLVFFGDFLLTKQPTKHDTTTD